MDEGQKFTGRELYLSIVDHALDMEVDSNLLQALLYAEEEPPSYYVNQKG